MIEVKMPELLTASLGVSNILHPTDGSLMLKMDGPSEATLTLEDKAESIPMHGWVKIYNQLGFVGIFRRISRERDIATNNTYNLRHGIDILQDSVWDAEETYEGTTTQFLTALLNKQTQLVNGVKPWVLGTCADTSNVKKDINYDNLLDLFEGVTEQGGVYYFTYDQTSFPWTVNLVAKPLAVESEFRLNRNIERCRISDNDSELCTRLILNVNEMVDDTELAQKTGKTVKQNESVTRTYNNAAAQANYGIIVKTADIDVTGDTFPSGPFPEADAWAQDFLNRRADPLLNIEIDGQVLKGITGFDWDDSKIGTQVRVALPEYATAIAERCVSVNYTSLYGNPDKVTIGLANALPTFSSSMKSTQKTVASNARGGRGAARQAESFDQHFQITDDAGNVLRQAGMHLDANGLLVYADDYENMVGAKFEVQANKIGMVVGTYDSGGNYIKAAEIATAINDAGEGVALINAAHVNISATSTAYTLAGELERDANGKLIIKSAGGLYVRKTVSGVTANFGVWDNNNLTAGVIATIVNGESSTYIKGEKIYIGNQDSVTVINGKCSLSDVTATYIGSKIADLTTVTVQSIAASGTISAGTLNGGTINIRHSAGAGYTYTNIAGAAMSSLTLVDNGNDTYTLKSYKIDGTETVVGTFNRGGGGSDRIAGWNDYESTSWKVPTDSDSGGKFKVPSQKDSNGNWSYVEWGRAFNSVVWSVYSSPEVQTSQPQGYKNAGTVGALSSNFYIKFRIKANGDTNGYYIYVRV